MRKIFLMLVLLSGFVFAQNVDITQSKYLTVTLDSTATARVYLLWQEYGSGGGDFYLSETAPTAIFKQPTVGQSIAKGGMAISIVTDTTTAQESDSLSGYIQSYNWDANKSAYYKSWNDSTFLVFDTPGTYTATSADQLDWTHGRMYTADVGGGAILPATGQLITFVQTANDNAGAATTIYLGVHFLR